MPGPIVLGNPFPAGHAPWDGTGIPFGVDETGWPQLPGGGGPVVALTLTADVATAGEGLPITLTAVADVDGGVPTLHYRRVSDAPGSETTAPMTAAAEPLTYTGVVTQLPYTNGAPTVITARIGESVSNEVTVQSSPVPVLTLEALAAEVVADAIVPVRLHTDKGVRGPQELWWSTTDEAALVLAGTFIQSNDVPPQGGVWFDWVISTPFTGPAGGTVLYRGRDSAAGGISNVVSMAVIAAADDEADVLANPRSDWTVPQLDQFAADNPKLAPDYPVDANKPEKLAYLKSVTDEGDD